MIRNSFCGGVGEKMKISVIVPVFNCEKFISESIECLQYQTLTDYEVIFIDDCSTDSTVQKLEEAVKLDSRFRYYRNETRRGAAFSRNRGIDLSVGSYILCLDADDRYEKDMLEQLINVAYEYDADMVMLERNDFYANDLNSLYRKSVMFLDEIQLLGGAVFSVCDKSIDFLLRCQNGTCDRMIRKELLDKYHIRFQNLKNSNDVFYILASTFATEKIVHTKTFDSLYHRRMHNEPGRISNSRDPMCAFLALEEVYHFLKREKMWEKYCIYFWIFALDSLEKQLFCCKDEERQKEVYQFITQYGLNRLGIEQDEYYKNLPQEFQNQYCRFRKQSYEEKCFYKTMSMEAVCEMYGNRIQMLVDRLCNQRVAFWGVGRTTDAYIGSFRKRGGISLYVIDNDVKKHGKAVVGVEIASFEEIWDKIDTILVSNRLYYNDIKEQVTKKNGKIKVLSFEEVLFLE